MDKRYIINRVFDIVINFLFIWILINPINSKEVTIAVLIAYAFFRIDFISNSVSNILYSIRKDPLTAPSKKYIPFDKILILGAVAILWRVFQPADWKAPLLIVVIWTITFVIINFYAEKKMLR